MADRTDNPFYDRIPVNKPIGAQHGPLIERPRREQEDDNPFSDRQPVAPQLDAPGIRRPNLYGNAVRGQLRKRWQRRLNENPSARLTGPVLNAFNALPGMDLVVSEDNPIIQEYQSANPTESFIGRSVARAMPYMGLARAGMNTIPRAAVGGAAIEGADALTRGDDPLTAAMLGGAFGTLGNAPRIITPRSRRAVNAEWDSISSHAHREAERAYNAEVRKNKMYVYRDPALARTLTGRAPPGLSIDRTLDRQHYISDYVRDFRRAFERGEIPTRNAGPFTRSMDDIANVNPLFNVASGAATGYMMGHNPALYALLGAVSGPAARGVRNTTERVINSQPFNRWYSNTVLPEGIRNTIQGGIQGAGPEYLNDRTQTLSTEDLMRAIEGMQ